jgi:UDP-N-acetylmuramoyl-tripeptide--D-alanyl-D-alanine ligase
VIPLPLAEAEPLGRLTRAGWTDQATGLQVDSRKIEEGDLFVVVGSGGDFIKHALARGAAAILEPDDAFAALAALGAAVRSRSSARLVGITGSTGKTSTKDILAALCAPHAKTVAAEGGHNNEIGLPLTLAAIEPDTEIVVAEMGMRGLGQIAELCAVARPDLGVITNVGPVHLELLGTVEQVARAKAEIVAELPAGGVAVAPTPAPELEPFLQRDDVEVRRFGAGGDASVLRFEPDESHAEVVFDVRGSEVALRFNFTARHQADNAAAALLAYDALGLPLERAQEGADPIAFSRWRGEETALPGEGLLINDAYNANPVSMEAALAHLSARAGGRRRVAVLGDMAELGPDAPAFHARIGRAAAGNADVLIAVGELAQEYLGGGVAEERHVATVEDALAALDEVLHPGDVVLVKASRSAGLERIAEALTAAKV